MGSVKVTTADVNNNNSLIPAETAFLGKKNLGIKCQHSNRSMTSPTVSKIFAGSKRSHDRDQKGNFLKRKETEIIDHLCDLKQMW